MLGTHTHTHTEAHTSRWQQLAMYSKPFFLGQHLQSDVKLVCNVGIFNFFTFCIACSALFYGQWQGLSSPAAESAFLKI